MPDKYKGGPVILTTTLIPDPYTAALQELRDAAMAFAVVSQTEPFLSHPHSEALGRLGRAAEDYAEAAIRRGNR